jgi:hypothetical protein
LGATAYASSAAMTSSSAARYQGAPGTFTVRSEAMKEEKVSEKMPAR